LGIAGQKTVGFARESVLFMQKNRTLSLQRQHCRHAGIAAKANQHLRFKLFQLFF